MKIRTSLVALATVVASLSVLPGCAVTRGQSSMGEYIDDSAITASVKSKFVEDRTVDAAAISVETLNGEVMLSGFARNTAERARAETLARSVKGVKSVKNQVAVRN